MKLTKCDEGEWGEKCHYEVTYFLNGPMFNLFFFAILFYIERRWHLTRKLLTILPLKSKLSGKSQRFNALDRSIKMLKNSWIFKNINLKEKHFKRFWKAEAASHLKEVIQPTHHWTRYQIKPCYVSGAKDFLRDI